MALLDHGVRLLGRVTVAFGITGIVWTIVLVLIISADVLGRALFNMPVTGVPEIVQNSLVAIVFLEIPYAMRSSSHVQSTVLLMRVPGRARLGLQILGIAAGFILFALIAYASWGPTLQAWQIGEFEGEGALRVPTYPIRTIILVSSVIMALECLRGMLRVLRGEEEA